MPNYTIDQTVVSGVLPKMVGRISPGYVNHVRHDDICRTYIDN